MARKGWNTLSPNYRARLEKNGISRKDYEAGASIQAARGHKDTPERPSQAAGFTKYLAERNRMIRRVVDKRQAFFGTSPKYNPLKGSKVFQDNPPSMAQLKYWSNLSEEEWLDAIREDPDSTAYLGYH